MGVEVYFILAIIGILIFYAARFFLRKFIGNRSKVNKFTWITTIVLTPVIYVGLVMSWISYICYYPSYRFDKTRWKENKEKRYELSTDIINSKILIGKTTDEVKQILGDADYLWGNSLIYYVGYRPKLNGIDPDVLNVEIIDGKVIRVSQYET